MKCSIVVPVYRGEQTLDPLLERLAKTLPKFFDSYEVILVNDGSPDNSWDVIKKITRK